MKKFLSSVLIVVGLSVLLSTGISPEASPYEKDPGPIFKPASHEVLL